MKLKQQSSNTMRKEYKKEHTKINVGNPSCERKTHKLALCNQWRMNGEHKAVLQTHTLS